MKLFLAHSVVFVGSIWENESSWFLFVVSLALSVATEIVPTAGIHQCDFQPKFCSKSMSENPLVNLVGILFPLIGLIKIPRGGIHEPTYYSDRWDYSTPFAVIEHKLTDCDYFDVQHVHLPSILQLVNHHSFILTIRELSHTPLKLTYHYEDLQLPIFRTITNTNYRRFLPSLLYVMFIVSIQPSGKSCPLAFKNSPLDIQYLTPHLQCFNKQPFNRFNIAYTD
jgi:hypothetical protein